MNSFLIIILLVLSPLLAFSTVEECGLDHITFSNKHLSCMRHNKLIHSAITGFLNYRKMKSECSDCKIPFINGKKFSNLYKSSLLSLGISRHSFGGYNLYVLFKGDPHVYRLWLYEVDRGHFQIREIAPESKRASISKQLLNKERLEEFWVDMAIEREFW